MTSRGDPGHATFPSQLTFHAIIRILGKTEHFPFLFQLMSVATTSSYRGVLVSLPGKNGQRLTRFPQHC